MEANYNIVVAFAMLLLSHFSRVRLCVTPKTASHQAPLSLGFSRQEHWSGLPFPSPVHGSEKWKCSRSVVSDSPRPHGLQPTRLLRPWDFPGKSTGVGCHCWISHGCTCVPHPEPASHLPPHPIPLGHPRAPAMSTLSHASNRDWQSVSHMIRHMLQCYSLKSSHPCLLPQSPKDCSLHLCLFCCLVYRVIVTIFLNSIYMH